MQFQERPINGVFYEYIIRGIPMVVKKISENRFDINYSKLVNLLYENVWKQKNKPINKQAIKQKFHNYITNNNFVKHVIYYLEIHNIEHNIDIDDKFNTVEDLCEKTNNIFYQEKGYAKTEGTYGPYEFVDTILVAVDPKYASMVHQIMHKIDTNAATNNQTFEEEYNETLYKLEQMQDQFEDYNVDIDELEEYRQLKEEIENHEYEFNPNINLVLTQRIEDLQKLQRDLRIYFAYSYYIIKRNCTHIENCKKPTLKEMLEIISPYDSLINSENSKNKELRKKIFSLATTNDDRFSKLIANEIIEIFKSFE